MLKTQFLNNQDTISFVSYLADILSKRRPLGFDHAGRSYTDIHQAFQSYCWPNRRIDIPTPNGNLVISAKSNYRENKVVLDALQNGIRSALHTLGSSASLADWAQAIMIWGGVYTRRGNGNWLNGQRATFDSYLNRALTVLQEDDDDAPSRMADLRSNAGTTKVHSMLLSDFVIYDSRVAAALAWLVFQWANECPQTVPEHLRFSCMRANSTRQKKRSPDPLAFPYFAATGSGHHHHAKWNLRANWIIEAATAATDTLPGRNKLSSRELEAALFMMGDELP